MAWEASNRTHMYAYVCWWRGRWIAKTKAKALYKDKRISKHCRELPKKIICVDVQRDPIMQNQTLNLATVKT